MRRSFGSLVLAREKESEGGSRVKKFKLEALFGRFLLVQEKKIQKVGGGSLVSGLMLRGEEIN